MILFVYEIWHVQLEDVMQLYIERYMCSQQANFFGFMPLFGEISFCVFETQMEVYKQLKGHYVQVYLDLRNLQDWEWWKNEHYFF
jgi:hypothetical protein